MEVIYEEGEINLTKLSLKVNLSYDRVRKILNELAEKKLLVIALSDDRKGSAIVVLTPKGVELLRKLRKLKSLLKDYGLL